MRRLCWLLLVVLTAVLAAARPGTADEPPDKPEMPEVEALPPETLGKLTLTLDPGWHTAAIRNVRFTPDGKQVVTFARDHSVRFWDAQSSEMRRVLRPPGVGDLELPALSADGKLLAVVSAYPEKGKSVRYVYVIRLADGRLARRLKPDVGGQGSSLHDLMFSGDGSHLAVSVGGQTIRAIQIWDLEKDEPAKEVKCTEPCDSFALSEDGRRVARVQKGRKEEGEILDVQTGKTVSLQLPARGPQPRQVIWSPDGKTLATLMKEKEPIILWEPDGKLRARLSAKDMRTIHRRFSFSADSRHLFLTSLAADATKKPQVVVFDTDGKVVGQVHPDRKDLFDTDVSPDGRRVASVGGDTAAHEIFVWDVAGGTRPQHLVHPSWLAGAPDKGWPAAGWGKEGVTWGKADRSFDLGELKVGAGVAVANAGGPRTEWDGVSLQFKKNNGGEIIGVDIEKDGKVLKSSTDLRKSHALPAGALHAATLLGPDRLAFIANGVAPDPERARGVYVYDFLGDKPARKFQGHSGGIRGVAPSPDGRFLVTTGDDQTLRVWAPDQNKALLALFVHGEDWIVWAPEGGYYAATPGGERLMGWTLDRGPDEMPSFYPAERFRKLLYQPDAMKKVLGQGGVKAALNETIRELAAKGREEEAQKVKKTRDVQIDEVLPPTVTIEVKELKDKNKLQITAEAKPGGKGQPVESLRLLLDGRPYPDARPEAIKPGAPARAVWTIEPPPGQHELKVVARCPDVAGVSAAHVADTPPPAGAKPLLYRICIGINEYDQKGLKLDSASKDAEAVFDALEKDCTGPRNRFGAAAGVKLLDKAATREAVLQALKGVRQAKVKPGDLVVVFFGGHGVVQRGPQGSDFYLLTCEADTGKDLQGRSLSSKDLQEAFADMPCSVLLIMDACHSTAAVAALQLKSATDDLTRSLSDDQVAVTVLAAAMGHETAGEQKEHGLFTQALLDALKADKGVPFDPLDHQMYVHHLYSHVFSQVRHASDSKQNPFLNMPYTVPPLAIRQVPER
jgi:WD40 repeat protein